MGDSSIKAHKTDRKKFTESYLAMSQISGSYVNQDNRLNSDQVNEVSLKLREMNSGKEAKKGKANALSLTERNAMKKLE